MRKFQYSLVRACLYTCIFFVGISCKDTDDFLSPEKNVNTSVPFDFSTSNKVDLVVDYSAYNTHGAVRFAVYNQNPVKNEGTENEYIDSSIEPIYEDFTDRTGKYDATVTLPAYAKVLHIVTNDFTMGLKRMVVEVVNGQAKAELSDTPAKSRGVMRVAGKTGPGELTDEFKNAHNLSFKINSNCTSTGQRVYKDWNILLGKWYENSGYPGYILDPETATPGLIIPQDEVTDIYEKVKATLYSLGTNAKTWSPAKKELVKSTDLTLIKDAEVSITPLGSQTCWTNTIGYYFYNEENKPTNPEDLNIIMLFPNTQNGLRYTTDASNASNQGNVGTVDGEAVQLMYYPNIEDEDVNKRAEGATKTFPAGTKIGFVLKAHGWGTQSKGTEYCIKNGSKVMDKKMNIWGASTAGCSDSPTSGVSYPNTTREARTAKYNIVSDKGNRYAITSFEDACDDVDFDDLVFALTPANAFAEMAEIEAGKTITTDVFAFEDMWPGKGDYDMNDVVVNCKNEKTVKSNGKVTKQVFYMTTYQKNVALVNGLAARVKSPATKSVVMKKLAAGETDVTKAQTVTYETFTDGSDGTIYYLTSKVEDDLGSTYILELTYSAEQDATALDEVIEPFIYRQEDDGQYWEVHIPYAKPTSRMNTSYFRQLDDRTDVSKGEYYVREGLYPFAFHLTGTKAEYFFDTILSPDGDLHPIDVFYPDFRPWSESHGTNNSDWYLHKKK